MDFPEHRRHFSMSDLLLLKIECGSNNTNNYACEHDCSYAHKDFLNTELTLLPIDFAALTAELVLFAETFLTPL